MYISSVLQLIKFFPVFGLFFRMPGCEMKLLNSKYYVMPSLLSLYKIRDSKIYVHLIFKQKLISSRKQEKKVSHNKVYILVYNTQKNLKRLNEKQPTDFQNIPKVGSNPQLWTPKHHVTKGNYKCRYFLKYVFKILCPFCCFLE